MDQQRIQGRVGMQASSRAATELFDLPEGTKWDEVLDGQRWEWTIVSTDAPAAPTPAAPAPSGAAPAADPEDRWERLPRWAQLQHAADRAEIDRLTATVAALTGEQPETDTAVRGRLPGDPDLSLRSGSTVRFMLDGSGRHHIDVRVGDAAGSQFVQVRAPHRLRILPDASNKVLITTLAE